LLPLPTTCIEESTMKTNSKLNGIKVNTGIKVGGFCAGINHNRQLAIRVKSGVKAGSAMMFKNHSVRLFAA
jgi:hypothetical protein